MLEGVGSHRKLGGGKGTGVKHFRHHFRQRAARGGGLAVISGFTGWKEIRFSILKVRYLIGLSDRFRI